MRPYAFSAMPLSVFITVTALLCTASWAWELKEHPTASGEWGYRPENEAVATSNPPSFTWRPEEEAVAYDIEVASDSTFETVVYSVSSTPWSAHCPNRVLAPGAYYWRYRGRNEADAPSEWSAVRRFTVPEDIPVFPMPDRDLQAMRIPRTHPRLFFRPEEAAPLRGMGDGPLAEKWEALVKQADKLIESPPDTSEPPKYPEGTERKGEEWRRIWWGNRRHAIAVADGAATLAFVYRLSGERRYGEAARDLMMALCAWDPKGSTQYEYNDEAAMPLLYYPARAYTWAYDIFSPEERARIEEMMRVRGEDCYNNLRRRRHLWRPYGSHANRAWHWLGEVATAFYDSIDDAPDWLDYSMTIFYTCYPAWGDADGGWHEGQAYWISYLNRFLYWAMVMKSPFGIDVFDRPFFNYTGDFGLYTCPPGTSTGAFGDQAILSNSQRIAEFMGLMGAIADNPYWLWFCEQHGNPQPGGYFGYLIAAGDQRAEARPPDDLPASKVFRGTGLAVLNSNLLDGKDNVQVHFKSSPFGTQSHGYNANNAFLMHLRGERALIRSGRRDIHGSPHHREWMWETKSDNAILVNGEGQYPHTHQAQGEITHFYTGDLLDVVAGEAGESYRRLDRWTRRILFFKPHVVVIHDVLEAPEPSTFQWLLHAEHSFAIDDAEAALETDTGRLAVSFLYPEALELSQKNEFDTPPHEWASFTLDEFHFQADAKTPAASQEFVAVIRVDDFDAEAVFTEAEDGKQLTLALPGGEARIALQKARFQVQYGDLDMHWEDK